MMTTALVARSQVTFMEMCDLISDCVFVKTGKRVPPESIFYADPGGELFPVIEWYERSREYFGLVPYIDPLPDVLRESLEKWAW